MASKPRPAPLNLPKDHAPIKPIQRPIQVGVRVETTPGAISVSTVPDTGTPAGFIRVMVNGCALDLIKTPYHSMTPAERSARRDPGNMAMFQTNFDEDTGIYRECPACAGYGIFPRDKGEPAGCGFCKAMADKDYQDHCRANPPISISTSDPEAMNIIKLCFGDKGLQRAIEEAPGKPVAEVIGKQVETARQALEFLHRSRFGGFVFRCGKCHKEHYRPRDPGLGSWDRPEWHKVKCCKTETPLDRIEMPADAEPDRVTPAAPKVKASKPTAPTPPPAPPAKKTTTRKPKK